jgi:hypothetical protein
VIIKQETKQKRNETKRDTTETKQDKAETKRDTTETKQDFKDFSIRHWHFVDCCLM